MANATILLIDDEEGFREIVKTKLLALHFAVVEAKNGKEALIKARETKPDFIVSDVAMPEMDGISMVREMKKDPVLKSIGVVLFSSYVDDRAENHATEKVEAIKEGALDVLPKTADLDKLIQGVVTNYENQRSIEG